MTARDEQAEIAGVCQELIDSIASLFEHLKMNSEDAYALEVVINNIIALAEMALTDTNRIAIALENLRDSVAVRDGVAVRNEHQP